LYCKFCILLFVKHLHFVSLLFKQIVPVSVVKKIRFFLRWKLIHTFKTWVYYVVWRDSRCVFMKIEENKWTFYFKTWYILLIHVFNVLIVKNIWKKIPTKINNITPLSENLLTQSLFCTGFILSIMPAFVDNNTCQYIYIYRRFT